VADRDLEGAAHAMGAVAGVNLLDRREVLEPSDDTIAPRAHYVGGLAVIARRVLWFDAKDFR
jgi:hypothetical protein